MFKKTKNDIKSREKVSRHFVFIEVPIDKVAAQVVLWGEAPWWPRDCSMQFKRLGQGDLGVGMRYHMIMSGPFSRPQEIEVTRIDPHRIVERTFVGGFLRGREVVHIGERANGTRIDYELHYSICGWPGKLFWGLFLKKKFDGGIRAALSALKDYATDQDLSPQMPENNVLKDGGE